MIERRMRKRRKMGLFGFYKTSNDRFVFLLCCEGGDAEFDLSELGENAIHGCQMF